MDSFSKAGWAVAGIMALVSVMLSGAIIAVQSQSVSKAQAMEVMRISERMLTLNEVCMRIRVQNEDPAKFLGLKPNETKP